LKYREYFIVALLYFNDIKHNAQLKIELQL